LSIEVSNESEVSIELDIFRSLAAFVLDQMKIHPAVDLGISFVDEKPMADLHIRWLDEEGPTDVLSFPMDELRPGSDLLPAPEGILGDVVICPQVAIRQAEAAGHTAQDEMLLLLTHGMLHLMGYDHAEPEEEREMFGLQQQLLSKFAEAGIA
jgi:probable rRNA maturation factor